MRLYDQSTSTPMKGDGKKWIRPNNFLPLKRDIRANEQSHALTERKSILSEMTKNANCGSETSASTGIEISKVYRSHTIYDDFRFDIDEDQELSTKSLSTLSTHSTLRHATQDAYCGPKKELPKPISIAKNEVFENISRYAQTSSIVTTLWESLASETDENKKFYDSRSDEDENNLNEEYLTPKLTLTQSSEESNSTWIEFNGFGSQNYVFSDDSEEHKSKNLKCSKENQQYLQSGGCQFDRNQSKAPKQGIMSEHTVNYTKYYEMLLNGVSVKDLLKIMKKDRVDPSIISLVLAASRMSHNP